MHIYILKLANYFMATVGRFVFTTGTQSWLGMVTLTSWHWTHSRTSPEVILWDWTVSWRPTSLPLGLQMTVRRLMVSGRNNALQTWTSIRDSHDHTIVTTRKAGAQRCRARLGYQWITCQSMYILFVCLEILIIHQI